MIEPPWLRFNSAVAVFVGDNVSGKSTLLEAKREFSTADLSGNKIPIGRALVPGTDA